MSHYQACIASLSDSLQSVSEAQSAQQADQDCRAKGLQSNSPELAECVLQSFRAIPNADSTQAQSLMVASHSEVKEPRSVKSFFYASPRETRRREEMACAQIGLEPPYGAFAMRTSFYKTTSTQSTTQSAKCLGVTADNLSLCLTLAASLAERIAAPGLANG